DPTPIGGTYFDMQAASINNTGQIAFFADYHPTPETTNSGWFAGAPGDWRKVVVFFDPIDDGNHCDRKTEPNNRPFVGTFPSLTQTMELRHNRKNDRWRE